MKKEDKEHLSWIYERLIRKHGEYRHYDYIKKFKEIIDSVEDEDCFIQVPNTTIRDYGTDDVLLQTYQKKIVALRSKLDIRGVAYEIIGIMFDYDNNPCTYHVLKVQRGNSE